jgi:hypothetical protein
MATISDLNKKEKAKVLTMPILHIYRSKPDQVAKKLIDQFLEMEEVKEIRLYKKKIDWNQVVDEIFKHKRVICWW